MADMEKYFRAQILEVFADCDKDYFPWSLDDKGIFLQSWIAETQKDFAKDDEHCAIQEILLEKEELRKKIEWGSITKALCKVCVVVPVGAGQLAGSYMGNETFWRAMDREKLLSAKLGAKWRFKYIVVPAHVKELIETFGLESGQNFVRPRFSFQ